MIYVKYTDKVFLLIAYKMYKKKIKTQKNEQRIQIINTK